MPDARRSNRARRKQKRYGRRKQADGQQASKRQGRKHQVQEQGGNRAARREYASLSVPRGPFRNITVTSGRLRWHRNQSHTCAPCLHRSFTSVQMFHIHTHIQTHTHHPIDCWLKQCPYMMYAAFFLAIRLRNFANYYCDNV